MNFPPDVNLRTESALVPLQELRTISMRQLASPWRVGYATDGACTPLEHQIFDDAHPKGLPPEHTCARELGAEPLPSAMAFACATLAPSREFRMMDGNRAADCPSVDSHVQMWKLPKRNVTPGRCRSRKLGVHVAPRGSGGITNNAENAPRNPQTLRESSVRELGNFLHPRRQKSSPGEHGCIVGLLAHGVSKRTCCDEFVLIGENCATTS